MGKLQDYLAFQRQRSASEKEDVVQLIRQISADVARLEDAVNQGMVVHVRGVISDMVDLQTSITKLKALEQELSTIESMLSEVEK